MAKKPVKPLVPPVPMPKVYRCTKCGLEVNETQNLKNVFYSVGSSLYIGNDKYIHLCKNCCNELYQEYYKTYKNPVLAAKRVCQILDIYFNTNIIDAILAKGIGRGSIEFFSEYIKKMTVAQKNKTYADTEADETKRIVKVEDIEKKELKENEKSALQNAMDFFGPGFTDSEYTFLQEQYNDWITRHECQTKAQEEIFKSLSLAQLKIRIYATKNNQKDLDSAIKSFRDLLDTANLQPKQNKGGSAMVEANTLGTLIEKWENEDPIPKPDPRFEDVDGIRKYVTVWFYGHMCKMLGIKNDAAEEYEREKAKYSVAKPIFKEDDEADEKITDLLKAAMYERDGDD